MSIENIPPAHAEPTFLNTIFAYEPFDHHTVLSIFHDAFVVILADFIRVFVFFLLAYFFWNRIKAFFELRQKKDLKHLIISVNSIQNGALIVRDVLNNITVQGIFPNLTHQKEVLLAVSHTALTPSSAVVELHESKHLHDIMRAVKNVIKAHLAGEYFRQGGGLPTIEVVYVMTIVYEKYRGIDREVIRCILTPLDLVNNPPSPKAKLKLQNPKHRWRLVTIGAIAQYFCRVLTDEQKEEHLIRIPFRV